VLGEPVKDLPEHRSGNLAPGRKVGNYHLRRLLRQNRQGAEGVLGLGSEHRHSNS
jgi:hypothetical protein